MARALMVQGTASGVGKSWLATALCAYYAGRGLRVAPFKAWNMSNNAAPAARPGGWGEIGRAQAEQARAAGVDPHVDMNPVLLKPMGLAGADVVIAGVWQGPKRIAEYVAMREQLWTAVTQAYARLSASVDLVVLEGAGSPAEINLRGDMANMAMAHHADAKVLLVGDIDRGGVFASLYGTVHLLGDADRARLAGLVINRFRGDPSSLRAELLSERCGVPVRGVIPFRGDIRLSEEDGEDVRDHAGGAIDVCVLRLPTVANFTDLGPVSARRDVGVRWAASPEQVGNPDLLVLPGSRDTEGDMGWLRDRRLDRSVRAAAARGIPILGICGGYQMLGERLGDTPGLGLLPVVTDYAPTKALRPVRGVTTGAWLLPAGLEVEGYEIHAGRTAAAAPLVELDAPDGAVVGLTAGTYAHGLFDRAEVADALVARLRERKGLEPEIEPERERDPYAAMAEVVAECLDLEGLV